MSVAHVNTDKQRRHHTAKMKSRLLPGGSVLAPVCADLPAEVESQPVDGAADVSQLLLGCEAIDVPAVPQHPSSQRHQHKHSPCVEISHQADATQSWKYCLLSKFNSYYSTMKHRIETWIYTYCISLFKCIDEAS